MNEYQAFFLIISISFGFSTVIMPSIVDQLGAVSYLMIVFSVLTFNLFTCFLANDVFVHVLSKRGNKVSKEMLRQPIKSFTQEVFGDNSCFSEFVIWLQTVVNYSYLLAFILVSATILQNVFPISGISVVNQIRLHTIFYSVLLVPISQIDSFKEMGTMSIVCFVAALLTEVFLLISLCIIMSKLSDGVLENKNIVQESYIRKDATQLSTFIIFNRCVGVIVFATSGAFTILPNVIVVMSSYKRLRFSISFGIVGVIALNFIVGLIPYYLMAGYHIDASFVNTLTAISSHRFFQNNEQLKFFIMLSQVTVTLHCLLATIISSNPVYLFVEDRLCIPRENGGWRRLLSRCSVIASATIICLIFQRFAPVLSWIGGFPIMLYSWIVPIVLYLNTFKASIWLKIFCGVLCVVFFTAMFTINAVDLYLLL